ncbi:ScbR family autoregulator-binding transcription factor [Pseudoclavibacter sp. RFBA6]|uniref:ScbR family autoregulator-binding transcription factor n=1 Tax=Pseudoclavibacter sp. RFBA6 TaxID=2080573 RepID=UPI0015E1C1D9|nr:ScbR family autoregulator-binding transcription factor [Pseudoclavibacter sp. RFBA6]
MSALPRPSNAPQQQRSVETRSRLVLAAATTFVEFGFAGSTLARIREHSGVTNGAFYHHFATREAVAEAVLAEYAQRATRSVTDATSSATSGIEALLKVSLAFARLLRSDVVVLAGVLVTTEIGSNFLAHGPYLDWLARLQPLIQLCQREGSIRRDVAAADLSSLLVSTFTGTQLLSGAVSCRHDLVARVATHWRIILPSLTTPEQAERVAGLLDSVFDDHVVAQ